MKKLFKNKILLIVLSIVLVGVIVGVILLLTNGNKKYTISFDTDGGSTVQKIVSNEGKTIKLPTDVTKEEYTFNGWSDNGKIVSNNYVVKGNATLKAIWISNTKETITITFDSDGGSTIENIIIEKGNTLTLPENPIKEGYTFKSWVDINSNPIYDNVLLAEDTTLKAVWEANKKYTCSSGYTLNGTKCTKTTSVDATVASETCPDGYGLNRNLNKCVAINTTVVATSSCPSQTTRRPGYTYCYENVQQTDSYTCTNNLKGQYTNGYCYYGTVKELEYTCPSGYISDINYSADASQSHICRPTKDIDRTYKCDSGYSLSGTTCTKTETVNATLK